MFRKYQKYEFCKDSECRCLINDKCIENDDKFCIRTAKEFHKWLKLKGFELFKPENKNEIVLPFTLKIN